MNKWLLCLLLVSLMACNNAEESKKEAEPAIVAPEGKVITPADEHNARNSLDWAGTYKGTLPCADCEGIETEIQLNQDSTYALSRRYLGKNDTPFSENGKWSWVDGSRIRLEGYKNSPQMYFVAEGKLIRLDEEGNSITGDLAAKYELQKIN